MEFIGGSREQLREFNCWWIGQNWSHWNWIPSFVFSNVSTNIFRCHMSTSNSESANPIFFHTKTSLLSCSVNMNKKTHLCGEDQDSWNEIRNLLEDPVNSLESPTADGLAKIEAIEIEFVFFSISITSILANSSAVGLSKLFTGSSNKFRISFSQISLQIFFVKTKFGICWRIPWTA